MAKRGGGKELREQILAGLDIAYEYGKMGLKLKGERPRASGKWEAYSAFREDGKASAWIDVNTGMYGDSVAQQNGEKPLSIFDFAVKSGNYPTFDAAWKYFAEQAGVELPKSSKKKGPENPYDKLDFEEWTAGNETLVKLWCLKHKPGPTLEAIKFAGGRVAYYPAWTNKEGVRQRGKNKVIAMPCYGHKLLDEPPVAWVCWNINGQPLEVWRGKDVPPELVKMKSCGPTAGTLMNEGAIRKLVLDRESVKLVWKTAGPSDMLTITAAIPPEQGGHIAICNASGEDGEVHSWNVELLADLPVNVIHDADRTGEIGALRWIRALAVPAKELRHVKLPYEVADKHGRDARHYLTADLKTYDDLLALAADMPIAQSSADGPSDDADANPAAADDSTAIERQIMSLIRLDVLGQLERGGVKVFSEFHRKAEVIPDVGRMSYESLLRIAGPPVKAHVLVSKRDDKPGMVSFDDVKQAIALLGGYKRITEQTELGAGCWQGMGLDGHPYPSVVLVGDGQAAEINGSGELVEIKHPRCKGHLLDFESGAEPWYDYKKLSHYLSICDQEFATAAMNEAIAMFDLFSWKHASSAVIATGLVMATWVQSIWEWRPQVAIIGPSNAGKSTAFGVLASLFGNLAIKSSHSSAAGIRQAVKSSSKIVICDEFESGKFRDEVLEMLRMSGRGDKVLRGTVNQKGQGFGLRQLAWVAAIEVNLKRAPDRNRFIMLELVHDGKPRSGLPLPSSEQLADLGQRLLAAAIKNILAAKPLAVALKHCRVPGIDDRVIESYAVPAAILATIQGFGEDEAKALLHEMLMDVDREQGRISDEADLLTCIFSQHVHTGRETVSVAQLIESVLSQDSEMESAVTHLGKVGIKIDYYGEGDSIPESLRDHKCLAIAPAAVTRHLLRNTPWEHQAIEQILGRVAGAIRSRRRFAGQRHRCILIARDLLEREFLGHRSEEPPVSSF